MEIESTMYCSGINNTSSTDHTVKTNLAKSKIMAKKNFNRPVVALSPLIFFLEIKESLKKAPNVLKNCFAL